VEKIILNRALNKEIKYYGLSSLGLMGAVFIGVIIWMYLGMVFGILGVAMGYAVSSYAARSWHSGDIQKVMYWHLPSHRLFGNKYLPESHKRCFM
jgi:hypothetical protein